MKYLDKIRKSLVGRTITEVSEISPTDLDKVLGWSSRGDTPPILVVLDDGTQVIPFRDPEGNGPGWLDVTSQKG